jgi:hypothetical protein
MIARAFHYVSSTSCASTCFNTQPDFQCSSVLQKRSEEHFCCYSLPMFCAKYIEPTIFPAGNVALNTGIPSGAEER